MLFLKLNFTCYCWSGVWLLSLPNFSHFVNKAGLDTIGLLRSWPILVLNLPILDTNIFVFRIYKNIYMFFCLLFSWFLLFLLLLFLFNLFRLSPPPPPFSPPAFWNGVDWRALTNLLNSNISCKDFWTFSSEYTLRILKRVDWRALVED